MHPVIRQAIELAPTDGYLRYHAPRYQVLLGQLERHYRPGQRLLDIGRSPFSAIAAKALGCAVDTLGFEPDQDTATGHNFQFDLNLAQHPERCRKDLPRFDWIVFAEVIEHLHTSPLLVLRFLHSLLTPAGRMLVQTPNAVVLHKRLQMLWGSNPFQLIAEDCGNPGHFREYTAAELADYARRAGFEVESLRHLAYFDYRYSDHLDGRCAKRPALGVINLAYRWLPAGLRPGLCAQLRRAD